METNSKKILAALPAFEEYLAIAEQIKELYISKMSMENDIKAAEAEAFRTVMTDPNWFINGKAVSASYFENCYKHGGLNGEILPLRRILVEVIATLDSKKTQLDIYKLMQDLYKALAYQEKSMS